MEGINSEKNKELIALVVVGFNRLKSLARLLDSLLDSNYYGDEVPLVISIDSSNNQAIYDYVRNYKWPFGEKFVNIQQERLGLKTHIFLCGDLSAYFKAVVILEDDLVVSPEFFPYIKETVAKYGVEECVAGISLYKHEFNGFAKVPLQFVNNGYDVFLMQAVVSWGQCWTNSMWMDFKKWYKSKSNYFLNVDMPLEIVSWKRAWSKYYYAYIISTNKFFVFPYISLSTNCGEAGEHGHSTVSDWQVVFLQGSKKYNLGNVDSLVKYDVYCNNLEIYDYFNIERNDLCLDLYGTNMNVLNKRYILTVRRLCFKPIEKYGLLYRPIEQNIFKRVDGEAIILYDTSVKHLPLSNNIEVVNRYYLRAFSLSNLIKYILVKVFHVC